MNQKIVHGLPITPARLLATLPECSFCVSFARPEQLSRAIELVSPSQMLILDNGAFSIWRAAQEGRQVPARLRFAGPSDYRHAFWDWANEAQHQCAEAVAVIPDVITGEEAENLNEVRIALDGLAEYPSKTMAIWHMNESIQHLDTLCRVVKFIGMGSCIEYDVQKHKDAYLRRLYEARVCRGNSGHCPQFHLMRGLGIYHKALWCDSADSTNIARNHHALKELHGDARVAVMHCRIKKQITDQMVANAQQLSLF